MLFGFLRANSALKLSVRDVFKSVCRDLLLPDEVRRIGRFFIRFSTPWKRQLNSFADNVLQVDLISESSWLMIVGDVLTFCPI